MSKLYIGFLNATQREALKAVGHDVGDEVKHVIEAAYVAAQDTPIGQVVAKSIADAKEKGVPLLERLEHVVEDAAPAVVALLSAHGFEHAIDDVKSWVRGFAQTEFNRLESTTAPLIAKDLLTVIHG